MAKPDKILAQELLNLEVLDLAAGEVVGKIIDLALTRTGQVALIGVLPAAWYGGGKGIAPDKIASVHHLRVCIEGSDALVDFAPDGEAQFSMLTDALMPTKQVLQEDGEMLGSLVDFAFNLADGLMCELIVLGHDDKRTKVPVESIRTIGKDYIVITRGKLSMEPAGAVPAAAKAEPKPAAPAVKPDPQSAPVAAEPPAAEPAAKAPVADKAADSGADALFVDDQPQPELSKYDQKKRDFLLGRQAHRDIKDKDGALIVAKDAAIDDAVIGKIIAAGLLGDVFIELTLKK